MYKAINIICSLLTNMVIMKAFNYNMNIKNDTPLKYTKMNEWMH